MPKLVFKTIKGRKYAYLEESIRIGNNVRKISKYIGLNTDKLKDYKELFEEELLKKKVELKINFLKKELEYPLSIEEVKKIEEMNFKYKKIVKTLHKKSLEDLNKRFIANYVFESNALEGNSLTLKNVAEVIFENRISKGKDLREIYDAQNSYKTFLFLQKTREKISKDFIIKIHSMIMKNIDDRLGYRKVPIVLLGKPFNKLTKPENVQAEMEDLINWYNKNENNLYPLELAFKFHAKFEKIHPFCDGNGRTGRFLLNYILLRKGYFPIIIRKTKRNKYLKSLEVADTGRYILLMRFALNYCKETFTKFFEVYYKYVKQ